ncbi:MAG: lipid-A-disaccharide synthase [Gammaproteobacteria bacterium]|nr:lipid-A-disaccharide synthase [Gammaproteobacteria bacterium]
MTTKNIMIIAGEASGDARAAGLVRAVKRQDPSVRFFGIGGDHLRAEGVETMVDSRVMAVVGLFEVLAHFRTIYGALQLMRRKLREERPDLLILVDYPDFNLRLAKTAKALGIKVLYYISPQVWAWRQKRVYTIKGRIDHMAVVFPFEVPFYEKAGVPVTFVGHPLVEEVPHGLERETACRQLGLDPARKVLGLFPGSRRSEITRLLPVLLDAAAKLHRDHPDLQFVLPRASTLSEADFAPYFAGRDLPVTQVEGRAYEVMAACDAIVSASGTATLEIALMQVPLVVIYRIAPLSYRIMRRLVRVDHIGLCNIVAGERIAPELIQDAATPDNVAAEAEALLFDEARNRATRERLAVMRQRLGASGDSAGVGALALAILHSPAS